MLIHAPRLLDPDAGFQHDIQLAIRDGQVVALGGQLEMTATRQVQLPADAILLPGLIDIHAHPARDGSVYGVDPDRQMLPHGVTTVLSQGDAGSNSIDTFVEETIRASQTRVKLAINISSVGESTSQGCLSDPSWLDPEACLAAIERHQDHVAAVAINASRAACGEQDPRPILAAAIEVAAAAGLPLLYGMRPDQEWPFEDQLGQLRPGDLVTYIFRRTPHCILTSEGMIHPALPAARTRGILFDVGHGCGSFDFEVACQAIEQGFPPDTISTDLQREHLRDPTPHTLPGVMAKLEAAGMDREAIMRAVTCRPAGYLADPRVPGKLKVGCPADLCALQWSTERVPLADTSGNTRQGHVPRLLLVVRGGKQTVPA
jgi:dihydroorotase